MNHNTKELAYIGVGVAALISGGMSIFQFSRLIPLPGMKYAIMAPYLSMVMYILLTKVPGKFVVLKTGVVFGFIMAIVNVYMTMAIIMATLLTEFTLHFLSNRKYRAFIGSSFYAMYISFSGITVSKYIIGGVFLEVSLIWIAGLSLFSLIFGLIGAWVVRNVSGII